MSQYARRLSPLLIGSGDGSGLDEGMTLKAPSACVPAVLFDWSTTDLSEIPTITSGPGSGFRSGLFKMQIEGFTHLGDSPDEVEARAWNAYHDRRFLLVPSKSGLTLGACPGCGWEEPVVDGRLVAGFLSCRGCHWTELGYRFRNHDALTGQPWPTTARVFVEELDVGRYRVLAEITDVAAFTGVGVSLGVAELDAFEQYVGAQDE